MQRAWRIFVVAAIFGIMLAPKIAFCLTQSQPDHTCCASEAKLSAQPCCPDAAPQVPTTNTAQVNWATNFLASPVIFQLTKVQPLFILPAARASELPGSPPDTILRT